MKKIALISTFCDTSEKIEVLRENILKIRGLNIDVMVISPIPLQEDILDLCDFYYQTHENPLLVWPTRAYTHWYEYRLLDGRILTMQRGLADYGWAGLFQVKKLSQLALAYDYDIFYHLIYDLEIDSIVESEFLSTETNIVHSRVNPKNPGEIWETTLHFMVFDRVMMENVEKEITLENYLGTNGMAEGEVLKWTNKFPIRISNHSVKDKIFYWEDYDFFDYSLFPDFKIFISKNDPMTIWVGESPCYSEPLSENIRIVFYNFESLDEIRIKINEENFCVNPLPFEYIEFPISSKEVKQIEITYRDETIDYTKIYNEIMMNQIYYNHRP